MTTEDPKRSASDPPRSRSRSDRAAGSDARRRTAATELRKPAKRKKTAGSGRPPGAPAAGKTSRKKPTAATKPSAKRPAARRSTKKAATTKNAPKSPASGGKHEGRRASTRRQTPASEQQGPGAKARATPPQTGKAPRRASADHSVVIVGAGPAGLTAGYLLCKRGIEPLVLESDPVYVGGLARTATYKGYYFDIGGHRFFSKSQEVEDLWTELLPDDMLKRPRKSRIYYNRKFFSYPLKPVNALMTLGLREAAHCGLSYAWARARPIPNPNNFEDWVINQFGSRLYEIFFKSYTEKVWGMSCREISADWAAQRIKGLSLWSAVLSALRSGGARDKKGEVIKTLIEEFRYPRKGPGMMWEVCRDKISAAGGAVRLGRTVIGLQRRDSGWEVRHRGTDGSESTEQCDHVICSAAMQQMTAGLMPAPEASVLEAARGLRYRDFLTVALIVNDREQFDDNWIYIQDGGVKVGRIQNFKAWSPEMVPDPNSCCYGLEYFCFEGDGLWSSSDEELVGLAKREMDWLGLCHAQDVTDGCVVRMPKAYPVYDDHYERNVNIIRQALERDYPNLHLIGRNGMHRYNNQDHAMMTAMLTVENIVSGSSAYNVWQVNQDAQYIESGAAGAERVVNQGGRAVPRRVSA